jgi:hypothetical protein
LIHRFSGHQAKSAFSAFLSFCETYSLRDPTGSIASATAGNMEAIQNFILSKLGKADAMPPVPPPPPEAKLPIPPLSNAAWTAVAATVVLLLLVRRARKIVFDTMESILVIVLVIILLGFMLGLPVGEWKGTPGIPAPAIGPLLTRRCHIVMNILSLYLQAFFT